MRKLWPRGFPPPTETSLSQHPTSGAISPTYESPPGTRDRVVQQRGDRNCSKASGKLSPEPSPTKQHTLGIVYSFFLMRMYVSFRQEVSKGGLPTSRVYLCVYRETRLQVRPLCRTDPILSTPQGFPGKDNALGISHAGVQTHVVCAWLPPPEQGGWELEILEENPS